MGEAMITRWRENRLGGRGSATCRGRGTFLKKGCSLLKPHPSLSQDFRNGDGDYLKNTERVRQAFTKKAPDAHRTADGAAQPWRSTL